MFPHQTVKELFEARDAAWRSFFQEDPAAAIERTISPNVIAIQENQEKWDNRARLTAMAKAMQSQKIQLIRLEFPRTEVQVFGDTAILYYTYIFETGTEGGRSGVDPGRGTEVFMRSNGRWLDTGWHLDNGAFQFKDARWTKMGDQPAPGSGTR
jgi:ketosteroid isomerase-like protein